MEERLPELPKGWVWTRLGRIADVITGNTPPKNNPDNYGNYIPFVKPPELKDCVIIDAEDHLSERGTKLGRVLTSQSVLVSCIGNLGKTGINNIPVAFNQQINASVFYEGIIPRYGFYYFQTLEARRWLNNIASATTISIVNKSKFETTPIPIAPFNEQHRIVAKIEELFTKLDAGVEALKKVKAQLKRNRQGVLKYAFEGKLTQEWREANKGKLEPASVLLERIKEERKKEAKGKFKDLPPIDTSALPELPEGWVWARLGQISEINPKFNKEGLPADLEVTFLPMRCVEELTGKIDLSLTKKLSEVIKGYTSFADGDLLFAKITPCMENGKVAVVDSLKNSIGFGSTEFHVIRLYELLPEKFFFFFLTQEWLRKDAQRNMTGSAGQLRVPATYMNQIAIPLAALREQQKIVEEIENRLSIADEIEGAVEQSLKKSDRLRQSILKKAFEGKLVPQDPTDEPAEKLLERIKEEKGKGEAERKANKRPKKNQIRWS
jgi:type I restriction enzyme S subunit